MNKRGLALAGFAAGACFLPGLTLSGAADDAIYARYRGAMALALTNEANSTQRGDGLTVEAGSDAGAIGGQHWRHIRLPKPHRRNAPFGMPQQPVEQT